MSVTLSSGSRRSQKSTCRSCNRTVVVHEVDGRKVECDPELLNVIPFEGRPVFMFARRAHADMCQRYQIDAAKQKFRAEQKAAEKKMRLRPVRPIKRAAGE